MAIGRKTRKDVLDWINIEGVPWSGRLSEEVFLDRVVDLDTLPSTDSRYDTARQDILQHRYYNNDWDSDWIYSYKPLALLTGSDDVFLAFLTEMLHPVVRPDSVETRRLAKELNDLLRSADVELYESGSIGDKPVWSPRTVSSGAARPASPRAVVPDREQSTRVWTAEGLRLFLSHTSAQKVDVVHLKRALIALGVSAFVAHEDIEPSLEWQVEIESALRTMDAMAALLTPDFHSSNWTDQEVGFALGQGILVIGVRLPKTPYGFMGKNQGLPGSLKEPVDLAAAIVRVLLERPETATPMREALVVALERSSSFIATKAIVNLIVGTTGFTSSQIDRMAAAIQANDQVDNYLSINKLKDYIDVARLRMTTE
jgi:hypothetical protein